MYSLLSVVKSVIFVVCLLFSFFAYAVKKDNYQDTKVKFSQTTLTVKQALDELSNLPEVDVVYNGSESFLDIPLTLPTRSISVKEALEIIKEQAPVDIVFNKGHIIIKSRKLKERYQYFHYKQGNTNNNKEDGNHFILPFQICHRPISDIAGNLLHLLIAW